MDPKLKRLLTLIALKVVAVVILVAGVTYSVMGAEPKAGPLVSVDWVTENLGKDGIVFLDVRSQRDYKTFHLPGAIHTNYGQDGWRVKKGAVKGVMPEPEKAAKLIGLLGIGNDDHVVIVANGYGAGEMGVATRIYWTFKVLGHDAVSLLDGGLSSYMRNRKNPLSDQPVKLPEKEFKFTLRENLLATREEVEQALKDGTPLIDGRADSYYLGIDKSGSAKTAGTLPGAANLPIDWMVERGGFFRIPEHLKVLFGAAKAPTSGKSIAFCNTGHQASVTWFVAHELLGNKDISLYDGSMAEWTQTPDAPVEKKIKF